MRRMLCAGTTWRPLAGSEGCGDLDVLPDAPGVVLSLDRRLRRFDPA